jgi:two-component system cell cycle sensor histidine kinase/response regulator CckA
MIRELVSDMLTSLGYEVEETCDGAEAIALYQRAKEAGQPFTAVILDVTIPGGMGGKEAIATLRAIDPQVKAIVSSGYSDDPVMANFRQYGFSGVVAKPYTVQGLSDALQRVMLDSA